MAARKALLYLATALALALALGMVGCRSGADAALDDASIVAGVQRGLAEDGPLARQPIRVDANRGQVILDGRVDRLELKDEAERIARTVEGVTGVTNRLEVADTGPPPPPVAAPPSAEP